MINSLSPIPVVAVIFYHIQRQQVMIFQRKETDSGGLDWEFPGGKVDKTDPSLESALCREILEELDVCLDIQRLIQLNSIEYQYPNKKIHLTIFAYEVLETSWVSTFKLNEHLNKEWVSFNQLSKFKLSAADHLFVETFTNEIHNLFSNLL